MKKKQNLAIFDLDNTLIAGDSDYLWGEFLVEQQMVDQQWYQQENSKFYQQYNNGTLDIEAYLQFSLQPLTQYSITQLKHSRTQFIEEKIKPILLSKAFELIESHRHQDDLLLIITATNHFITEPIAHLLNIPHLLATDPEYLNHQFTGKIAGIPCFQKGKVDRLKQWLVQSHIKISNRYFYSDSHNDIPLLETVDYPCAVDPDPVLKQLAHEQNWPIISLRT